MNLVEQLDSLSRKVAYLATEANLLRIDARTGAEKRRARSMRDALQQLADDVEKMASQARWQK